jgi:two-component system, OmpR family, phosphate regulon response regulator PhoB
VRHRELARASRTRQNWRGMTRDVHPRILIVEDERDIVQLLEFGLRQAGFETVSARDAGEAFARLREKAPDAVILDLMLPDLPGTEVCRQLKSQAKTSALPVIMLTARTDEVDRVVGFELGADDYITKPFSVREVVLRVKAVLRRGAPGEPPPRDQVGPVRLDREAHRVFVDGSEIELTALEFRLLETFMARVGRVQTREQLLRDVWEMTGDLQTRTVDTHVKRLREKLLGGRDLIETVRGLGYRMSDPAEL